jgi:hypothetical protein
MGRVLRQSLDEPSVDLKASGPWDRAFVLAHGNSVLDLGEVAKRADGDR